jgi:hypothetical protein
MATGNIQTALRPSLCVFSFSCFLRDDASGAHILYQQEQGWREECDFFGFGLPPLIASDRQQ